MHLPHPALVPSGHLQTYKMTADMSDKMERKKERQEKMKEEPMAKVPTDSSKSSLTRLLAALLATLSMVVVAELLQRASQAVEHRTVAVSCPVCAPCFAGSAYNVTQFSALPLTIPWLLSGCCHCCGCCACQAPKKKPTKGKSPAKRAKKADMPKAKKMQETEA